MLLSSNRLGHRPLIWEPFIRNVNSIMYINIGIIKVDNAVSVNTLEKGQYRGNKIDWYRRDYTRCT